LEREADRAAEAAMSDGKANAASPASEAVQRKSASPGGTVQRNAAAAAARAVSQGGAPLSPQERAYFEPRFGRDFSGVRIHTHDAAIKAARDIDARAYTLGRNIAFAAGEFEPGTRRGGMLLAHELAHTVQQQAGGSTIQRKLRSDPQAPLDNFLRKKGVTNFMVEGNTYEAPKGGALSFEQEMLIDMLSSPRAFNVEGGDEAAAGKSLNANLAARTGIVTFAAKKTYTFASVAGFKMNPQYYDVNPATRSWKVKQGVDKQTAWDDLNANPTEYAIGCAAATDLTQMGGSKGAKFEDKPSADETDWVAGESGYIVNTAFKQGADIGLLGENIIYVGGAQFWGHFSDDVTYKSLDGWKKTVAGWHGQGAPAAAKLDPKRELPMTGLL
ncbi:MAG: DUF4157 domain-containing protein, partial [Mesorhizobium sp.]